MPVLFITIELVFRRALDDKIAYSLDIAIIVTLTHIFSLTILQVDAFVKSFCRCEALVRETERHILLLLKFVGRLRLFK